MISGPPSCFPNGSQGLQQIYNVPEDVASSSLEPNSTSESQSNSLLYSLSLLKEKVHQVQSMVSVFISPNQAQSESAAIVIASMGTLIQEIIVTASSMMFTCQQMSLGSTSVPSNTAQELQNHHHHHNQQRLPNKVVPSLDTSLSQPSGEVVHISEDQRGQHQPFYSSEALDWFSENNYSNNNSSANNESNHQTSHVGIKSSTTNDQVETRGDHNDYDIIELDAADLLAKYTHYCQVCGKGFKRDANLRMHMRAHGDEYKSNAALSNPMKNSGSGNGEGKDCLMKLPRKYSCPQEGCRWNRKHAKFQPLKSMICVKNHYKRSHCPKMYVCKRCNRKQFSVLSDLRTHEKHCGDLKWQCSCGTTFSRKDKLMGHVALFVGHVPAINCSTTTTTGKQGKLQQHHNLTTQLR